MRWLIGITLLVGACSGQNIFDESIYQNNPVAPNIWERMRQLPSNVKCSKIRVRREVTSLTAAEFAKFANAVWILNAGKHPTAFDAFTMVYMNNSHWVQGSDAFFPWNRRFLWTFEEALRSIDPDVTLPYWDWSMTNTPEQSPVFDQDFCGGNGDPNYNMSVTSGMFAQWKVQYPAPHFLSRDFQGHASTSGSLQDAPAGGILPSFYIKEVIDSMIYNIHGDMYSTFRQLIAAANGNVLTGIGGDMGQPWASNDPLFYLCLAYIDYIYYKYQQRGPPYNHTPKMNMKLNPFGVDSNSVLDSSKQLCYSYEDPPSYAIIKGYLDGLTDPRLQQDLDKVPEIPIPTLTCVYLPYTNVTGSASNSSETNKTCDQHCMVVPPPKTRSTTTKSKLPFSEIYCTGYASPCPCSQAPTSTSNSSVSKFPSVTPNMTRSCYYVFPNGSRPIVDPTPTEKVRTVTTTYTATKTFIKSNTITHTVEVMTETKYLTSTITPTVTKSQKVKPSDVPVPTKSPKLSCSDLIQKFSCKSAQDNSSNNGYLPPCDAPTLDPKLVMLCNGIVKSIDDAPLPNSTFSMVINWNNPLNVLADQLNFLSGRLNGSTLCPLDPYDRNDTLLLRQPVNVPSEWIKDSGLNEGLVRMQEQVVSRIYHILNVETLRAAFLSVSNPVVQQKIIRAYPSLCRGMPINIVRDEVIVVNKTKIIKSPMPKVITTNETVYFDPLANISASQLQKLSCQSIHTLLQQENANNLTSMIYSMLNAPAKPVATCTQTLRVIAAPTPLTPDTCKKIFGCGGNPINGGCCSSGDASNNQDLEDSGSMLPPSYYSKDPEMNLYKSSKEPRNRQ